MRAFFSALLVVVKVVDAQPPSGVPTSSPSWAPTSVPTTIPSPMPTNTPSSSPSSIPSTRPSPAPSTTPTNAPTTVPTTGPSSTPTRIPTASPSSLPTSRPSASPSSTPSSVPSHRPSSTPTSFPTTPQPSNLPTAIPSSSPSQVPTLLPTSQPTTNPTTVPTPVPSSTPSTTPSSIPTSWPTTSRPSPLPSSNPSATPSSSPTNVPSVSPSSFPTTTPTSVPTSAPSSVPTGAPTGSPTSVPTGAPSTVPSASPTLYSAVIISDFEVYAEEGQTASYGVWLSSEPADNVVISITTDDETLVALSTSVLNFTSANYNVEQTVTLTAVENGVDTNKVYNDVLLTHNASSGDSYYDWPNTRYSPGATVRFRIFDDDSCTVDCAPGEYFSPCNLTHTCLPCYAGAYCFGGCAAPIACPKGTAGLVTSAKSVANCTNCSAGTYATTTGSTTCSQCPAGSKCPQQISSRNVAPVACPAGKYSHLGASTCTTCQKGFFTTLTGQTSCDPIPAGFAAYDPAMEPQPCSPQCRNQV